jgi:putative Holliday junction resolvase
VNSKDARASIDQAAAVAILNFALEIEKQQG